MRAVRLATMSGWSAYYKRSVQHNARRGPPRPSERPPPRAVSEWRVQPGFRRDARTESGDIGSKGTGLFEGVGNVLTEDERTDYFGIPVRARI